MSGNVVSGETELECEAPESMSTGMHEDGDGGSGSGSGSGENGGGNEENCSTANLTPGAVVQEAELRVSSAGANWERVGDGAEVERTTQRVARADREVLIVEEQSDAFFFAGHTTIVTC